MTAAEVTVRWDNWFSATKDEESIKPWKAAKDTFPDNPTALSTWAHIIELNRLNALVKKRTPAGNTGGG